MTTQGPTTADIAGAIATDAPDLAYDENGDVPSVGSGLFGRVWAPGLEIRSISDLLNAMRADPEATFTATEIAYGSKSSDTSVVEFLHHDGGSVEGDGGVEMGPSGLALTGYIYIPPGVHELSVISDDGFALSIGGSLFSLHAGPRGRAETAQTGDFEGGLYEFELLYFDKSGSMSLTVEMDGMPIDGSAFYQSVDDFTNPPDGVPLVPATDYHPGYFLGPGSVDEAMDGTGTEARDVMDGYGANDVLEGLGGDDELRGHYGDDILRGGEGDDVLDGGRGSDLLDGGDGNDLLISGSDAGEQRIGQLAVDMPTRGDPDGEVDAALQKLIGYEYQPLKADDVMIGGAGEDTFLITPQINAKEDIIAKHVKADGTINWAGVAGENDELHDHWVDSFGIKLIADYDADDDQIAVIGHTANVYVYHEDVIGDDNLETIINVVSNQHGGGGAHDLDLIGQIVVHGDLLEADDIQTDANVTYGVVDGWQDLAEALYPIGETKEGQIDGVDYKGYDTREPTAGATKQTNNGLATEDAGVVTGNPMAAFDNPFFTEDMLVTPDDEPYIELTRYPFEQLGTVDAAGSVINGTDGDDHLTQPEPAEPAGLPGAIGYWSFADGMDGAFNDARGDGPAIKAYTLDENAALLRTNDTTEGPGALPDGALYFDGEDDFAYLAHDPSFQVTQGTVAMWVRPDDLSDCSMFVTKDHLNTGDGGHFRLGHNDDGGLFLRMAPGDGGSNRSWETGPILEEGEWQHIAVSFTEDGVTVYLDGDAIPAGSWTAVEGNVPAPNGYTEASFLMNQEPWVFGADTHKTELNDTAQEFGVDDEDLRHPFEGGIADFGFWGGYTPGDALTQAEIQDLIDNGPGEALINPSGPEAMIAADDMIMGGAGNDTIEGGAGDDMLDGGDDDDTILGGYGDDHLKGGAGNDILDGERGSDLLEGGDGDDVLLSRSDVGEDRAGQLVLGEPSRPFPDESISNEYLKLIDWIDQPVAGDDVLVGGAGADHFKFETLINGKLDILNTNLMADGRTIHWHGVAGENAEIHDHWVDSIGIDVIADYNADEDHISVIGHTTEVSVDYKTIDTDGDGLADDAVSIITAYSQQGNGGGAHDEDILGYIVVHGDPVDVEDIEVDAGAHYGIVDTIDEAQEAVAPTGETKSYDNPDLFGYDSRDVDGDPIASDPEAYSSNSWLQSGAVEMSSAVGDLEMPVTVLSHAGGSFDGTNSIEIPNTPGLQQDEGTWGFNFSTDTPATGSWQVMLSKDHSGFKDGGHLSVFLNGNGTLKVRFQDTDESVYLYSEEPIEAGTENHVAFTFEDNQIALYLNGELQDVEDGFADGMLGNAEDTVLGASTMHRNGDNDNLNSHFTGEIGDLVVLDRALEPLEVMVLADGGGDPAALADLYDITSEPEDPVDTVEEPEDPVEEPEDPVEEPEDPVEEPEDPVEEPEDPVEEPEDPVEEPEDPVEEPEDPVEEPEDPVEEPEDPVEEPEEPVETPEEPVEEPEEEEEEEETGIGAALKKIVNVLLGLLGLSSVDEDTEVNDPTPEELGEAAGEIEEILLSDVVPVTELDEDEPFNEDLEDVFNA